MHARSLGPLVKARAFGMTPSNELPWQATGGNQQEIRCIYNGEFEPVRIRIRRKVPVTQYLTWSRVSVGLDILLVVLLVYQVLGMSRGTRAVPMLARVGVDDCSVFLERVVEITTRAERR